MPTPTSPDHDATKEHGSHGHFIQCRVPTDLYEWMRLQGFLTRHSMNSIALASINAYRAAVEAGGVAPERGTREGDEATKYNVRVGDELYEWLRATAFHARTSINALLVAALARAHAAQTDETPRP